MTEADDQAEPAAAPAAVPADIAPLRAKVEKSPANGRAWFELGRAYGRARRFEEALDALMRAMALAPKRPEPRHLAWRAARSLGRFEEALALAQAITDPTPDEARWVGGRLVARQQFGRALPWLERTVAARPDDPDAWFWLGVARQRTARLAEAIEAFRRAVALRPGHAEAWNNLGNTLKAEMRIGEAYEAYRQALAAEPDKENAHRNLLFAMQYDPDVGMADLLAAHRTYGEHYARPRPPRAAEHNDRPLRVGYVSADFGGHPVGYFMLPVFAHHDRRVVEVFAYAGPRSVDVYTERLRQSADHWIPTGDLDDEALADRIQADGIDILVDLGGHTRGSRIRMFGLRPAPVQVTWAGYVGTTGLATIDWLIGDARHTPPGYEAWTVERIWRLPRSYICWEPPATPAPGPLPMLARGYPLLACMNNMPKLNPAVVALWAEILCAHPSAHLRLITKSLGDDGLRERLLEDFARHGVAAERVELQGRVPRDELLRIYRDEVDLALDPFPYSGGLTTLEALWSGVPVVTLGTGERFCSRHSLAHLGAMGQSQLVATSPADYRAQVARWLEHPSDLARLRASLRPEMQASVLCDGLGFTRELEAAFRGMWALRHERDQGQSEAHPGAAPTLADGEAM